MSITKEIKIADLPQNCAYANMFVNTHKHVVINCTISDRVPDGSIDVTITGKWNDLVNPEDYAEVHEGFTFDNGKTQFMFVPTRQYDVIIIEFNKISIPAGVVITVGVIQTDGDTDE